MADKVRNRKEILEKVSNNQTLNLDGSAVLFASRLEQDEFISYARSEIERQRNIWRVSHSRFHHFLVLLHGADRCVHLRLPVRNDGGRVGHLPERVRVLTLGRYHYCMVLPCLSTCIMLCVATVRRCVDV